VRTGTGADGGTPDIDAMGVLRVPEPASALLLGAALSLLALPGETGELLPADKPGRNGDSCDSVSYVLRLPSRQLSNSAFNGAQ
jgi:hypothetical protein